MISKNNIIIIGLGIFFIGISLNLFSFEGGSVGGYSGGENSTVTCGTGGCHGGTNLMPSGWITTDIPTAGYLPGISYVITISASNSTFNKFGFEMSSVNMLDAKVGTFDAAGTNQYKVLPAGNGANNATHTQQGSNGTNNSKTWNISWVAPANGTGEVTFKASVIAADGNGQNSGDQCYYIELDVPENPSSSILETNKEVSTLVYPNPVGNNIVFNKLNPKSLKIYDLSGKLWNSVLNTNKLQVSNLPKGNYFIEIILNNTIFIERFIKK